ncbi:MAG: PHB depolymerase family esterase [Planctomycetota bacterium]
MRSLLLILSMALAACSARAETLMHDGVERTYAVDGTAGNAPALLVLHGGGGTGERIKRYTRFNLAQKGWTVIYPDGLDNFWSDGRTGLDGAPLRQTDDVGFLQALIARLTAEGRIDPAQVYAVGVSNGGAMTQRLICQAPGLLAGAVVTVMTFPVGLNCPPGPPTPITFILGTADPLVPYQGGAIQTRRRHRGAVRSADQTLKFYADRNRCQGAKDALLPDRVQSDGVRVRKVTYTGCAAPLHAYIMDGGGHVWPGRRVPRILKSMLGAGVFDLDGETVVEDFVTSLAGR